MRKLGLASRTTALAFVALVACKAAPERTPAEASAPSTAATPNDVPTAPPSAAVVGAGAPTTTAAPTDDKTAAPRLYGQATKSVSAKAGERFGIALESNVTVPFKWRLDPTDAAVVTLVEEEKHRDAPPQGCSDCVGYGGTKVFVFEAKSKGTASLHFALKPLTDPAGKSQKDVTISVTVTE